MAGHNSPTKAPPPNPPVTWNDLENRHLHYMEQSSSLKESIQAQKDHFTVELQRVNAAIAVTQQQQERSSAANRDFYQEFKEFRSEMNNFTRHFMSGTGVSAPPSQPTIRDTGGPSNTLPTAALPPQNAAITFPSIPGGEGSSSSKNGPVEIATDYITSGVPVPPSTSLANLQLNTYPNPTYSTLNFQFPPLSNQQLVLPRQSVGQDPTVARQDLVPFKNSKPRYDFPKFSSGNPTNWLYKAELYFRYHNTNPYDYLFIASMHIDPPADAWFQGLLRNGLCPDWTTFKHAIHDRFSATDYEDPLALIHWEGYPQEEATWEDLSTLDPQLVQQLRENCTCQQPPSISSPITTGSQSTISVAPILRETSETPHVILSPNSPFCTNNFVNDTNLQEQLNMDTTFPPTDPAWISQDLAQQQQTNNEATDRNIPDRDNAISAAGSGIRRSARLQHHLLQALRRLPVPPRRRRTLRLSLKRRPKPALITPRTAQQYEEGQFGQDGQDM